MPVCPRCGAQVAENAKFCNACGAALDTAQTTAGDPKFTVDSLKDLNNTADSTAEFDPADVEKNKVLCIFSYLGLLFLIPLLACQNSKFARYHVNQGLLLFITNAVLSIITGVIGLVITAISAIIGIGVLAPILSLISGLISLAASIVGLVLMILGIINAVNGRAKELPIIGKFRLMK